MKDIIDYAAEYEELNNQISQLQDRQIDIQEKCANYKIPFGKYKFSTLAEIAHIDSSYYFYLKQNNLLPFTLSFEIDHYIRTKFDRANAIQHIRQMEELKRKQGSVGRYAGY